MVTVEVTLENSFEIHEIPSIPNLPWSDNNIMALQIVYDRLLARASHDGIRLRGLRMCAHNPDWQRDSCLEER
jgi:hypothetical protein